MRGNYSPYPVRDPTADARAMLAGRVYRAVLDDWLRRAATAPEPGQRPAEDQARSALEVTERLGRWSLRWQEAQDNAARSLASRYRSLADHLERMTALEDGRYWRETVRAAGGPVAPDPPRASVAAARFFRPIGRWEIDRILPARPTSERPLNPRGAAVTFDEQLELADQVYHAILDEAVARSLASPREGEARREAEPHLDALLAERLGFWSDVWSRSQDADYPDPSTRPPAARRSSASVSLAGAQSRGPFGRTAAIQAHIERMGELERGRFLEDALKRAGRSAAQPIPMKQFPEFAQVARFFRIEAETWLTDAASPRGSDVTDSSQAETAGRIYRAILDGAAYAYRDAPRAGGEPPDVRRIFDPRLAERLAAWSARWAGAQIRTDSSRLSSFAALRSHLERMASLEDGRSLRDALQRAGLHNGGRAAPAPPREFADVARFFRLEALWELEQLRSR